MIVVHLEEIIERLHSEGCLVCEIHEIGDEIVIVEVVDDVKGADTSKGAREFHLWVGNLELKMRAVNLSIVCHSLDMALLEALSWKHTRNPNSQFATFAAKMLGMECR
jgi:hypothetical protein